VGKILATAPKVKYIHEPFNPDRFPDYRNKPFFSDWFQYICEDNSGNYESIFEDIIHSKSPIQIGLANVREFGAGCVLNAEISSFMHRLNKSRVIIKDPIAFFSADWFCHRFDMHVIVMVRHPAAFCSSLKLKQWSFDFNNFLKQPLLIDKYMSPFKKDIETYAKDEMPIIDQAILLWNIIYYTASIYREKNRTWLFIKHEDVSRNPTDRFRSIFQSLDLEFTKITEKAIIQSSGEHNPSEQLTSNEFIRDSVKNIMNWKVRLTQEEVQKIKIETSPIWKLFYSEAEW